MRSVALIPILLLAVGVASLVATGPWLEMMTGLQRYTAPFPYLTAGALLLGLGVAGWVFLRPPWRGRINDSNYLLLFLLILAPNTSMGLRIDPSDIAMMIVLGVFAARVALNPETEIVLPNLLPMLMFCGAAVASSMVGGFVSLFPLPSVLKLVLAYYLVVNLIPTRKHAYYTMWFLVVITSGSAVIGIFQEIVYVSTGEELVGFISDSVRKYMYEPTALGPVLRVPAFTGWYVVLGNLLVVAILFLVNLLFYGVIDRPRETRAAYVLVAIMLVGMALTFSRSSELCLAMGLVISAVLRWHGYLIHMTLGAIVLVFLCYITGIVDLFIEAVQADLTYLGDLGTRIELLERGIKGFFHRHPWLGAGIGHATEYTANIDRWPVHNAIVLIADEMGIVGVLGFLIFLANTGTKLFGYWLRAESDRDRGIIAAIIAAFVGLIINLQFHPSYRDFFIFLLFGVFEGVSRAFGTQHPMRRWQPASPRDQGDAGGKTTAFQEA
jgi:hypothetical protein